MARKYPAQLRFRELVCFGADQTPTKNLCLTDFQNLCTFKCQNRMLGCMIYMSDIVGQYVSWELLEVK